MLQKDYVLVYIKCELNEFYHWFLSQLEIEKCKQLILNIK